MMARGQTPRTYLRSRTAVYVVVALITAGAGIATIHGKSERWVGHWPSSSAVVGWATLWGACVAAAAAAWIVAAPRRNSYQDTLDASSRSKARTYGPGLAAVAAASLTGSLGVFCFVLAATTPDAVRGGPDMFELLPILGWVAMPVGLGATLGRYLPPILAPVVAAVTPYFVYMWSVYTDIYINRPFLGDLLAMDDVSRDYLRIPVDLLIAKSVLWLAGGGALLAFFVSARRWAYGLAIACGLATAVAFQVAGARVEVPEEYAVVCLGEIPRVCVDRAHDHLADEYRDRIVAGLARAEGLDLSDVTIVQSVELFEFSANYAGTKEDPSQVQIVVPIAKRNTTPAHEIDGRTFPAYLGYGLFLTPCLSGSQNRGAAPSTEAQRTATMLYDWWLTQHSLPRNGANFPGEVATEYIRTEDSTFAAEASAFKKMSDAERAAWFAQNQNSVFSCEAGQSN
jgi:hypothetical protein